MTQPDRCFSSPPSESQCAANRSDGRPVCWLRLGRAIVMVGAAALLACSDEPKEQTVETVEIPREPAKAPVERPLFSQSRGLMGTVFIIKVDAEPSIAAPAVRRALDEIERLETVLSEWRDDSEISRINAQAGRQPVEVSQDVFVVVKAGVDVSRWSDGAFDLSWAALRGLYDFRPGHRRIPRRRDVRPRLELIDWHDIELDEEKRTVFLKRRGMAIGTGGIGKGYALDRAGAILRSAGINNYMLFGGGQVQVHGLRSGRPWRVGIQHPRRTDAYFAFFEAESGSISTSGDYEHFYIDEDGTRWHHILDTRTGLPARRSLSVTLVAQSGLYADALSTASFIMGPERAVQMLGEIPEPAEVIMLGPECELHATDGAREGLRFRMEPDANGRIPHCER